MTIKDIVNVHYLSCVEAYFGAWIGKYIPLPSLYSQSYLPWSEIVRAFSDPSVTYTNFSRIKRLQTLAEEAGITDHRKINGIPEDPEKNRLLLLSVSERFFTGQKAWRSDHYIAVTKLTKRKIVYLNEYPLGKGEISISEFYEKFGGDSLVFSLRNTDVKSIGGQNNFPSVLCNRTDKLHGVWLTARRLRDAIGILRVLRRRTVDWLGWSADDSVCFKNKLRDKMLEQIRFADRCYFDLHRMILRGKEPEQSFLSEMAERIGALEATA